jgi:hypothetical protein
MGDWGQIFSVLATMVPENAAERFSGDVTGIRMCFCVEGVFFPHRGAGPQNEQRVLDVCLRQNRIWITWEGVEKRRPAFPELDCDDRGCAHIKTDLTIYTEYLSKTMALALETFGEQTFKEI